MNACRGELEAQLAAMESKVLQGEAQGGLSALARRQEEVLRSQQQQLKQQRSRDAAKLRQIADMEEAALMAQGKYSSLQAMLCALHCIALVEFWPETRLEADRFVITVLLCVTKLEAYRLVVTVLLCAATSLTAPCRQHCALSICIALLHDVPGVIPGQG